MKLNFNSFTNYLIFNPIKAEKKYDRVLAAITSIALLIFLGGLGHLVCAIRNCYLHKKYSNKKISKIISPFLPSNSLAISLKNKLNPKQIGLVEKVPIFQIQVCSQTEIGGSEIKCGYHALKNGLVALGIVDNSLMNSDLTSKEFYTEFMHKLNSLDPEEETANVATLKILMTKLRSFNAEDNLLIKAKKIILKYFPYITIFDFSNNLVSSGILGVTSMENFNDILSFIELHKKLKSDKPFYHLFIVGERVTSYGHWISLILEKDTDGKLSWYGMDSWANQEHYITNLVSKINGLLNDLDDPDKREKFLTMWYNHIINNLNTLKHPDLRDREKLMMRNHVNILNGIKFSLEFMEKAGWLELLEKYLKEKKLIKDLVSFYQANGFSENSIVIDALKKIK